MNDFARFYLFVLVISLLGVVYCLIQIIQS